MYQCGILYIIVNNHLVSDILEHKEFSNLINSIDVYVRQLAAPQISTVNNMLKIAQQGIENYYSDSKPKPEDFDNPMNYMNETVVDEDDFLRFRISERFNQILRDVFELYQNSVQENVPKRVDSINEMTGGILSVLNMIKSGKAKVNNVGDAVKLMMKQMNVSETDMIGALDIAEELFNDDSDNNKE